ncbi:MAG: FliM/FliN family flagellar motor switch protein [Phycisphaerales bacterium]
MSRTLKQLLTLEVPVIVRVGTRKMSLRDIMALVPGSIIEIDKPADEELDLLINNRHLGFGVAVKVGENFGVEVTYLGDVAHRADPQAEETMGGDGPSEAEIEALAEAMLSGMG